MPRTCISGASSPSLSPSLMASASRVHIALLTASKATGSSGHRELGSSVATIHPVKGGVRVAVRVSRSAASEVIKAALFSKPGRSGCGSG
eukprot:scaffold2061_cov246-Pinguiococcus_pyrenoidosus.AAC.5